MFGSATPAVAAKTFRDMIYSTTRQQFDESKAFTCMATLPQFHAARWSFRTLVDHPSASSAGEDATLPGFDAGGFYMLI